MTVQDRILLDPVSVPAAVKPHLSGSKQEAVAAEDRPDQIGLAETYGWKRTNDRGYSILEQPLGTLRPLRIIHIGAGASGICFSKFAADELRDASWVCYEKNEDVGGTWLENRYPGCACDIPSANYQFTWARNPDWSQYYSTSPEIWKYFKNLTEQYDLMKYIKLGHQVTGAFWDEDKGKWYVKVKVKATGEEIEDTCDVLINGGGVLNKWKWPRIEGLHTFEGKLMHSAAYEEGYPLDGKRVAVVGIGSSGVQIVPNIVDSVEKLYVWIRSPTWITAGFGQRFAGPNGHNFHCKFGGKVVAQYLEGALCRLINVDVVRRNYGRDLVVGLCFAGVRPNHAGRRLLWRLAAGDMGEDKNLGRSSANRSQCQ